MGLFDEIAATEEKKKKKTAAIKAVKKKTVVKKKELEPEIQESEIQDDDETVIKSAEKPLSDSALLLKSVEMSMKKLYPRIEISGLKREIYETFKKQRDSIPIPGYLSSNKKMNKFLIAQFARISDIKEIGIPKKENEQIRFITKTQLNTISFLIYLIEEKGPIDECIMSHFYIGKKSIEVFKHLMKEGKIKNIFFQMSSMRLKGDPEIVEEMKNLINDIGRDRAAGLLAWTHTKILCCRIKNEYYVIEGSGNLSNNARIEQYLFEKSKDAFIFHSDWIKNVSDFSAKKDIVVL